MAYQQGTSTGVQDLFDKLSTFAVANGWTQDHAAAGRLFLSRGTNFVSFRWDTGTPANAGIYHALAFSGSGTDPGNHTDDSGQGVISGTNATIGTGRHVPLVNSSARYWFFEDDFYIHIVQEFGANEFRHFGFGRLDKFGDNWTGDEYAYGWRYDPAGGTSSSAVRTPSSMLLDGLLNTVAFAADVHMVGIPGQAAGKWGVIGGVLTPGNDRGGTARTLVYGGYRGNTVARAFGRWGSNNQQGLVSLYPINIFAKEASNTRVYNLGSMKDVRGVSLQFFNGADEVIIGSDTWIFFPSRSRADTATANKTVWQGIAYKKVP